jgi:hypothetical protein
MRRLSKTSGDIQTCGRVSMFLSQTLPLSERSALNISGKFNDQNKTEFCTDEEEFLDSIQSAAQAGDDDSDGSDMETDTDADDGEDGEVLPGIKRSRKKKTMAGDDTSKPAKPKDEAAGDTLIDYQLYTAFWSLQNSLIQSKLPVTVDGWKIPLENGTSHSYPVVLKRVGCAHLLPLRNASGFKRNHCILSCK